LIWIKPRIPEPSVRLNAASELTANHRARVTRG
jgi:hypothetical protein